MREYPYFYAERAITFTVWQHMVLLVIRQYEGKRMRTIVIFDDPSVEHVYDSDCSASLDCIPSILNEVAKDGFQLSVNELMRLEEWEEDRHAL
jgi:hypothetical protein